MFLEVRDSDEDKIAKLTGLYELIETGDVNSHPQLKSYIIEHLNKMTELATNEDSYPYFFRQLRTHTLAQFLEIIESQTSKFIDRLPGDYSHIQTVLSHISPAYHANVKSSIKFALLVKYLISKVPEEKNLDFLKLLLLHNALPNHNKAEVINSQKVEKQQELLRWILGDALSAFDTKVVYEGNKTLMVLSDFVAKLSHINRQLAEDFYPSIAQIVVDQGSPKDFEYLEKTFPGKSLPPKSTRQYSVQSTIKLLQPPPITTAYDSSRDGLQSVTTTESKDCDNHDEQKRKAAKKSMRN